MIKSLVRSCKKNFVAGSFLRNLSVVMSGGALAQLINFLIMPVISRLFTATDFGIFGTYGSVMSVVSAGITLQYIQAIILSENLKKSINVLCVSIFSSAIISVFLIILSLVFQDNILRLFSLPNLNYVLLIIISSFIFGINLSLQSWCIKIKSFKIIGTAEIIRSMSFSCICLIFGFIQTGAIGLVLGALFSNIIVCFSLWKIFFVDFKNLRRGITIHRMMAVAREFRDLPLFATPQNLMNAISQGMPVVLLGSFYGVEVAGFYAFGVKILQAPVGVILNPLRQVLFQKATETYNLNGDYFKLYFKISIGLAIVGFIPSAIVFIWSPQIFALIFGSEWIEAGVYARWLILWIYIGFINPPSIIFAKILRKQKILFLYECLILSSRIIVLVFGGMYLSSNDTIVFFSILGVFLNLIFIFYVGYIAYSNKNMVVLDCSDVNN